MNVSQLHSVLRQNDAKRVVFVYIYLSHHIIEAYVQSCTSDIRSCVEYLIPSDNNYNALKFN